ncbi:ABC transporter permease subunit [Actinospica sp.]|jgi:ABC-type transport system involved in multi-copper enzyme maturation permease subunit|uniref:ABC transporter permease subunit n=1 Tax=Actinospica sp. TaxID=1872142 RepID=UPI002BED0203|nr:ABC transporter permease subunit [Actinospica sp.]HWG28626.1 ABC transporter permease subunit [Actinospica sp.]
MSATTLVSSTETPTAPTAHVQVQRVTMRRVLASEWIKLRSLRSTRITLLVAFLLMAGVGILFSAVTANQWSTMSAGDKAGFDPTQAALRGHMFAQLAVGVLGVLVISGEYATGMIRASLTAVPKRLPVLWGKSLVFGAVTLVAMTIASLIAFFGAQSVLTSQNLQTTISASGVLRSVLGAGLYLTVVGLIGVALGGLMRNTAGAISTLLGVLLLLPVMIDLLPSSIRSDISPYLPSNAGEALLSPTQQAGSLAPWTGFAVMCVYAAVALVGAAFVLKRRDA